MSGLKAGERKGERCVENMVAFCISNFHTSMCFSLWIVQSLGGNLFALESRRPVVSVHFSVHFRRLHVCCRIRFWFLS